MGARGEQRQAEARQQRLAPRHMPGLQILRQIGRAHHQAAQARAGRGDLFGVEHAHRRFDHAHDRHVVRRAAVRHQRLQMPDLVGALHLWQQDGVGAAAGDRRQVGMAPAGIEAVDPDDDFARAVPTGGNGGADLRARRLLGVGRNGVFQIENQDVGGKVLRLFERAGVGAGHIEGRAARPCPIHNAASGRKIH